DLSVLIESSLSVDVSFARFSDAADILTPYAIAFRYPGDVLEPSEEDAQEALELAKEFFSFVDDKLSKLEEDVEHE
ncbi:MAG: HEPN domain-containing protein, partial [Mariprofundaceae bacterium]|nr:HEPN domain-containing protein [Mariprofundaceae bacterium]